MSRREFVQRVAMASAVAGIDFTPHLAAHSGALAPEQELTGDRSAVLTRLLDHLVPAHGRLGAAGSLGVAGFVAWLAAR